MIDERVLEAMLGEVADAVELPDGGLAAVLAGIREAGSGEHRRLRSRLASPRPVAAGLVLVVLAVSATLVLTHRHSPAAISAATSSSAPAEVSAGVAVPAAGPVPDPSSGVTAPTAPAVPTAGSSAAAPRVVRTATVALQVATGATGSTLTRISALVTGDGGYVQDSTSSAAGPVPTGTLTLRIPSADYSRVRDALTGGTYGTVQSLQELGTDVTAPYTDLSARLDALSQTRASYLALLGRAQSIPDVLAVQAQLSTVQQQIESLQGQLKVLADTSDDATITAQVSGPPVVPAKRHHRSGWAVAVDRAGHGLVHDLQAILARSGGALVVVLAAALLAALAFVGTRLVRRRLI